MASPTRQVLPRARPPFSRQPYTSRSRSGWRSQGRGRWSNSPDRSPATASKPVGPSPYRAATGKGYIWSRASARFLARPVSTHPPASSATFRSKSNPACSVPTLVLASPPGRIASCAHGQPRESPNQGRDVSFHFATTEFLYRDPSSDQGDSRASSQEKRAAISSTSSESRLSTRDFAV